MQTSREMLFDRQKRRPLVEIPRCLKLEVAEEAYHIVHKTLQSELTTCAPCVISIQNSIPNKLSNLQHVT